MSELSGFSAAQPLASIGPQSLRLPTSMGEVCECESGCGASRILRGLAQIVASGLTDLIEINVQAVPTPERVQVVVIPWKKDGVARNGVAIPGGWIAVDGSEVVGMGNGEYASRWSMNVPLEWDAAVTAEVVDGAAKLTFPQPTSANRPFTYTVTSDGQNVAITDKVELGGLVVLTLDGGTGTYVAHVGTQYSGIGGESDPVTVTEPEPATLPAEPEGGSQE